jgi:hypothetical protein
VSQRLSVPDCKVSPTTMVIALAALSLALMHHFHFWY